MNDQELLTQVDRAIRVMSKCLWRAPYRGRFARTDVHIDRAGYAVLGTLADLGESRLSDVALYLDLDISTVSRQVKVLDDSGLVTRRPDPDDKRASLLTLSADGQREFTRLKAARVDILTTATASWTPDQRRDLLSLLENLATGVAHVSKGV